jgi:hypothetical protein
MREGDAPVSDFQLRADYARGIGRAVAEGPAELSWIKAPRPIYDPRMPRAEAPDPVFSLSYRFAEGEVAVGRGGGPQKLSPALSLVDDPSGAATLGSGGSWTSVSRAFGPVVLDMRSSSGDGRDSSSFGVSRGGDDWGVRLGYSSMADTRRTLGGTLQSRFGGEDSTRLSAMSLEASKDVGRWTLSGEIEAGTARIANLDVSGLWTSSWSLSAQHKLGQGVIRFSAAQPRRAEGGELAFEAPVFLTKEGRLIYETRIAGLTPSGRELDLETAWSTRLGDMTTFEAAAALSLQPNHVARAEAETAFWVSLRHFW